MSLVRTVYVPRLSQQLGSSERDEPRPDQTMDQTEPPSQCQTGKRGKKRGNIRGEKTRSVLKVKFPKLNKHTLSKNVPGEDGTLRRRMLEHVANKSTTPVNPGGEVQCAGSGSDCVGGEAFFFSQRSTSKAINAKEKAKFAVLRTISKMLEENQLIRQRQDALRQAI